jgi:hypothetical protein
MNWLISSHVCESSDMLRLLSGNVYTEDSWEEMSGTG